MLTPACLIRAISARVEVDVRTDVYMSLFRSLFVFGCLSLRHASFSYFFLPLVICFCVPWRIGRCVFIWFVMCTPLCFPFISFLPLQFPFYFPSFPSRFRFVCRRVHEIISSIHSAFGFVCHLFSFCYLLPISTVCWFLVYFSSVGLSLLRSLRLSWTATEVQQRGERWRSACVRGRSAKRKRM